MASGVFSYIQNLWPLNIFKTDDLKASARLVHGLSIPEQTKQFVFAVCEPDSHAVVYILAAQNLSEQSAQDAQHLIKEVQPEAVVVQVAPFSLAEIQADERSSSDCENNVPTSSFEVLKRCLIDKVKKDQYDNFARNQVLHEIFGIGFYGHILTAKRVAEDVGSRLLVFESPYENTCSTHPLGEETQGNRSLGLHVQTNSLRPGKVAPVFYSSSYRFCLTDSLQSQMVKSLIPSLDSAIKTTRLYDSVSELEPRCNYRAPLFAQSVYPLLVDLHDIFHDLPAIRKALVSAQKMLDDVTKGEPVDTGLLSEVHNYRIAVEALRVALNNAARCSINKTKKTNSPKNDYSELPSEEKCHALVAQALRSQARKYGSLVAIVDAGSLAGLIRHWNTSVPVEVAELAKESFIHYFADDVDIHDDSVLENTNRKMLLSDKPVVAVGAGATVALGASSLSKAAPVSTFFKVATYKLPVSFQYGITHMQKTASMALTKIVGPSKLLIPKVASVGARTSAVKLTASAEKVRAVTHGMVVSAKKTSLLAIRTSFYEIMRRRGVKPVRLAPWVTFGCSVMTCAGLLSHGDGIECAAEAIPSVPAIASLGRGLQSMHQASLQMKQAGEKRIQEVSRSILYSLKK